MGQTLRPQTQTKTTPTLEQLQPLTQQQHQRDRYCSSTHTTTIAATTVTITNNTTPDTTPTMTPTQTQPTRPTTVYETAPIAAILRDFAIVLAVIVYAIHTL